MNFLLFLLLHGNTGHAGVGGGWTPPGGMVGTVPAHVQRYVDGKKKHPFTLPDRVALELQAQAEGKTVAQVRAEWERFYVMLAYYATEMLDE